MEPNVLGIGTEQILSFLAAVILVIGLVGNAFEIRKTRLSIAQQGGVASTNVFMDKRNGKWYLMIGIALALLIISRLV